MVLSSNVYLHSDAIDVMLGLLHQDKFETKIKEFLNNSKTIKKMEQLFKNHEQGLLILINTRLFKNSWVLPETHYQVAYRKEKTFCLNEINQNNLLLEEIIGAGFQNVVLEVFNMGYQNKEQINGCFSIDKEGKSVIESDNYRMKGFFSLKQNDGNKESMRNLASGKLIYLGNMELNAYLNVLYEKEKGSFKKFLCLYASDNTHNFVIIIRFKSEEKN